MGESIEAPTSPRMVPSRRVGSLWLTITFVLWAANVTWQLSAAQADARAGEEALRSVADLTEPTDVDLDEISQALSTGRLDLERAEERLTSPMLLPLRPVPVVGRQLSSARSLIAVTGDIVDELDRVVDHAREARADPNRIDRITFLQEVADGFETLDAIIDAAELGPDTDLLPELAEGRYELETRMLDLQSQAQTYQIIAEGLAEFLDESSYLLVGANNAEMRLGTGMFLSIGRLEMRNGDFELPGLTPAFDFLPIEGASVIDADVARMWGFTSVGSDFRGLGYSARFDEHLGPQALELWEAATGERLDGVVMVDPFVLDALLGVIGDVEVDGRVFSQGDALNYMLSEQYVRFDGDESGERRDVLSLTASAVVDELGVSAWDPVDLLRELEPVAAGRHIMAYSIEPNQQSAWQAMGIDGALSGDETGVFLLNHGASKLDAVVELAVQADIDRTGDATIVTYDITVTNNADLGVPEYVAGPWESLGLPEYGTYLGRVAVYVPAAASRADFLAGAQAEVAGIDGDVQLVSSGFIEVRPGARSIIRFRYELPADVERVRLMPSGRFPAVTWQWNSEVVNDAVPRILTAGP